MTVRARYFTGYIVLCVVVGVAIGTAVHMATDPEPVPETRTTPPAAGDGPFCLEADDPRCTSAETH